MVDNNCSALPVGAATASHDLFRFDIVPMCDQTRRNETGRPTFPPGSGVLRQVQLRSDGEHSNGASMVFNVRDVAGTRRGPLVWERKWSKTETT